MSGFAEWLGEEGVGLYAAVVSTVLGVRQLVESRRRLRVSVDIAQMWIPVNLQGQYQNTGDVISFTARNIGAHEIRLNQCGLALTRWRWGRQVIIKRLAMPIPAAPMRFPYDLSPGQSASFHSSPPTWCSNPPGEGWRAFRYVYFTDAVGRTYKSRVNDEFFDELDRVCAAVPG